MLCNEMPTHGTFVMPAQVLTFDSSVDVLFVCRTFVMTCAREIKQHVFMLACFRVRRVAVHGSLYGSSCVPPFSNQSCGCKSDHATLLCH